MKPQAANEFLKSFQTTPLSMPGVSETIIPIRAAPIGRTAPDPNVSGAPAPLPTPCRALPRRRQMP